MNRGVLCKEDGKLLFLPFSEEDVEKLHISKKLLMKDHNGIYSMVYGSPDGNVNLKAEAERLVDDLIYKGYYEADSVYFKREVHIQNIQKRKQKVQENLLH